MGATLIFDGDCGVCQRCANFVSRRSPGITVGSYQSLDLESLGVTAEQAATAALWVDGDGVRDGHDAIAAALVASRRPWTWLGRVLSCWPVAPLGRRVYPVIARNRHRLPGATAACEMPKRTEP